jgi:anti-sigma regulatory factor (Ser/Thr protein kinase)
MSHVTILLPMKEHSQVGEARRAAQILAETQNLSETQVGQFAIITTELANNLIKHAGAGEILLRALNSPAGTGVEIIALDKGKGIIDIERCMEDGYSTAGSPGTGLGAAKRLASVFDIYSKPDKGTAIVAQLLSTGHKPESYVIGTICIPYPGERLCGDGWSVAQTITSTKFLMVDGLGHGEYAAKAADISIELFQAEMQNSPTQLMHDIHGALRSTRGAAAAVVEIDKEANLVRFAGVGNIAGFIFGGAKDRGLASYNGTLGHQLHKVQENSLPWTETSLMILHSDGLGTRWKLDDYPGLRQRHPALIAAILYRDFTRHRDDTTIMTVKEAA